MINNSIAYFFGPLCILSSPRLQWWAVECYWTFW